MTPFWVKFSDRGSACISAKDKDEALAIAQASGTPVSADVLPYPADPQLGTISSCPPFCWTPESCKGRTCCPKDYACSE